MDQAQPRSQVKQKRVAAKTPDGTEINPLDWIFWYDSNADKWDGGKVKFAEVYGDVIYSIKHANCRMSELEWAVAEGRVKPEHVFVAKDCLFATHEINHMIHTFITG